MSQALRAAQLRAEWGDKPCDHPDFRKEYYRGMDTGDVICTQCGRIMTREEFFKKPSKNEGTEASAS